MMSGMSSTTTDPILHAGAPLSELEALLPPPPQPIGSYVPALVMGNLLYTSGTLPVKDGQVAFTGPLDDITMTVSRGQEAARLCMLNALSIVKATLGSLERVERIVKVTGFVSSIRSFHDQPAVVNGASELLTHYFGEEGKHVRSAVGVISLPRDASVEIELVVAIKP